MKKLQLPALLIVAGLLAPVSPLLADQHLPPVQQTESGIRYVNGGIGYDEAQWFTEAAQQYPLRLMFSEGECGRAVTNVAVHIDDKNQNTVFALSHAGPQLLVDLPSGQYKVKAIHQNKAQGARFSLNEGSNIKVVLNWKNCVEEDSLDLPDDPVE